MTASVGQRMLIVVLVCVSPITLFYLWQLQFLSGSVDRTSKWSHTVHPEEHQDAFLVGVGKADITGPVVEINMMGYADTSQTGTGLRQRLFCRAFIIGTDKEPESRIAYLVLDTQSGDTAIRYGILQGLDALGPEYEVYTRHNGAAIAITGTHSHSGPGAWLNYLLPQITSLGFEKSSYQAIVDGCVLAVQRAHSSLQPGRIRIGTDTVQHANINRSPYAYHANPKAERDKYDTDVDKTMTLLSFQDTSGHPLGLLSWFPVHGTSLYQNNTLISGDNKGLAAYLVEEALKTKNPSFVAGFSQANVGDTTPNVLGAFCQDTGLPCRFNDSTCGGRTEGCHGRGPLFQYADQGTRSCYEIGKLQAQIAQSLLNDRELQLIQPATISSFHTFVDMSNLTFVSPSNTSRVLQTCTAALGYGFAGGTSDGPGAFDFTQGANDSDGSSPALRNPVWKVARAFIHQPSETQKKCQYPKPILLDVGAATEPYAWTPNIVDIQMFRLGPLVMIIAPGEATTMAGRRWRNAISAGAATVLGIDDPIVVVGGPSNTYAHYIATEEEYSVQRYEGASTLYGPHELEAYINLTMTYLPYLGSAKARTALPPLALGPPPPINVDVSWNFNKPVIVDHAGLFRSFGDVIEGGSFGQPFFPGDVVSASFVGANPRNNLRLEGTFAAVECYSPESSSWTEIRTDRDWYLVYRWNRTNTLLGTSQVTIEWQIEDGTEDGLYRLKYYGDAKSVAGAITPFEGTSGIFRIGR